MKKADSLNVDLEKFKNPTYKENFPIVPVMTKTHSLRSRSRVANKMVDEKY